MSQTASQAAANPTLNIASNTATVRFRRDGPSAPDWAAGTVVSTARETFIRRLEIDALSVVARLTNDHSGYGHLLAAIHGYGPDRRDVRVALRFDVAAGHALRAMGERDRAIDTWSVAQERLWAAMVTSGNAALAGAVACGPGETGRDIMAGRGLSLADELALALLERDAPGDVARALTAVERGRAVAATLERGAGPAADAQRNTLRMLDKRHAERTEGILPGRVLPAGMASRVEWRREKIRRDLAAMVGKNAGGPTADTAALVSALPPGAGVLIVIAAESGGALVAIGACNPGCANTSAVVLGELNRKRLDELLVGRGRRGGFLEAVEDLREAAAGDTPGRLAREIAVFADRLRATGMNLQDWLADPCCTLLDRHFGGRARRITWIVPGVMWPLPLHAMRASDGRAVAEVQAFGRSLAEVTQLAQRLSAAGRSPRATLVVDNPTGDIALSNPFTKESLPAERFDTVLLPGKKATVRAVLRALHRADIFLFNGHGQFERSNPERSGLLLAGGSATHGSLGDASRSLLIFAVIRRLSLQQRGLALLAACDVGSTELDVSADNFDGLASELLSAGFSVVIAATWPVEASATTAMLQHFLAALQADPFDPAAALSVAQRAMATKTGFSPAWRVRKAGPSVVSEALDVLAPLPGTDPYWWGGFRVIGC